MAKLKHIVLDVLKPHQPNALDFAAALADLDPVRCRDRRQRRREVAQHLGEVARRGVAVPLEEVDPVGLVWSVAPWTPRQRACAGWRT